MNDEDRDLDLSYRGASLAIADVAARFPSALELFDTQLPHMSRARSIRFTMNRRDRLRATVNRSDIEVAAETEREVAWHYALLCSNHARHLAMLEAEGPIPLELRHRWTGTGPTSVERGEIMTHIGSRLFAWWHPGALAWVRMTTYLPRRLRHRGGCPGNCWKRAGMPAGTTHPCLSPGWTWSDEP